MSFSANLGFLFTDRPLPGAIRAAHRAGFEAVECHFPYDTPPGEVRAALEETGLPMLGLNTVRGDVEAGDFGLSALPGREGEARAAIEQALAYAREIGARAVHVMAGRSGGGEGAEAAFRANLAHACERAGDLAILIEPINRRDAPGYHLSTVEHAAEVVRDLGGPLGIMFDAYHVQIMQGDLIRRFEAHRDLVGHVQIAAVPDRGEPDEGEVHFPHLLAAIRGAGWAAPIGAEYRPRHGSTEAGLGWLDAYRQAR